MNKFFKPLPAIFLTAWVFAAGSVAHAQDVQTDVKGNAGAGQAKAAVCMGCHSIKAYNASFPEVHKVPKISGQNAKFLISALNAYKSGDRKHPSMRSIASSLSAQDIADVAEFYSKNGAIDGQVLPEQVALSPSPEVAALLNKGGCAACHGANFAKSADPSYPKIAGQHSDYLYVALKAYKTEKNPIIGRGNPIMGGVAKQFSNQEMRLLANYIGSIDGDLKTVPQARSH